MPSVKTWLEHPLTRGLDLDDPQTTLLRRQIIREKGFLRQIYQEWYEMIAVNLPVRKGPILELGSGAGFLKDVVPDVITSDIFYAPGVDVVLDGQHLPFANRSLGGVVLVNVLHHLPSVRHFFSETARCVQMGGVISLLDPWVTPWSKLIYRGLHHEPFLPGASNWEFPSTGPLSGANGALAWILFERDKERFEREFPEWMIKSIELMMPFRYLLSGGVSLRSLMPTGTFRFWRNVERIMGSMMGFWAMFACVRLLRIYPVGHSAIDQDDPVSQDSLEITV